jgi:hypothetical protein
MLRLLPVGHYHCAVTSPPYSWLRDYGVAGQIGHEDSVAGYIDAMASVMDEVCRSWEQCQCACDELIDVSGRAALQAVWQLSAEQVAGGPPQQGKRRSGGVVFHGQQAGMAMLSGRELQVQR